MIWGTELITWLQSFSGPVLDSVVKSVTAMGSMAFYLILLPIVYWCIDKRAGIVITYVFLASAYLSTLVKGLVASPRPYQAQPLQVKAIAAAEGYAFPSAHAQVSSTVWGYLAGRYGGRFWIAAVGVPLVVGASRVYLGVHGPADVLGGWAFGAACAAAAVVSEARLARLAASARTWVLVCAALVVPIALAGLSPNLQSLKVAAAIGGSSLGVILEQRHVRFVVDGKASERALRFFLGALVVLALHVGVKLAVGDEGEGRSVVLVWSTTAARYYLTGLWIAFLAPWAFIRLGLARKADG